MYTPDEGYTGKDSFTARCTDKFGGRSNVVKQTLRVTKPTAAAFDDMDGHWANSAVLLCTGAGVFDEGGSSSILTQVRQPRRVPVCHNEGGGLRRLQREHDRLRG